MDLVYPVHHNAITAPNRRQSAAIIVWPRACGQRGPFLLPPSPFPLPAAIMVRGAMTPHPAAAAPTVQAPSFSSAVPGGGERLALDGLTLAVPSGAVFGLLGPNGSGKSTLLSLIAGLRQPPAGEG